MRCTVFMLTHDIDPNILKESIRNVRQNISSDDDFIVIMNEPSTRVKKVIQDTKVKQIELTENYFFLAFNIAAEQANESKYVAFLNDDITGSKNWLNLIIEALEKTGAVMGGPILHRAKFDHTKKTCYFTEDIHGIPYLNGSCLVVKRKEFCRLGGFPICPFGELKALYSEDTCLTFKILASGFDLVYVPNTGFVHLGGKCTNPTKNKYHSVNQQITYALFNNQKFKGKIIEYPANNVLAGGDYKYKINLGKQHSHLGDALTGMAAAIQIAEQCGECEINNDLFHDLFRAYKNHKVKIVKWDQDLSYFRKMEKFHLIPNDLLKHYNYVGCIMAAAGFKVKEAPKMICPDVPPLEILRDKNYVVLQPYCRSISRNNLKKDELEQIINYVKSTGLDVVISGKPDTPKDLPGATYLLGDAINYCRVVKGAKLAIGSDSAIVHIAAGYNIPMVMWTIPERYPYMWLYNYPGWKKIICKNTPEDITKALKEFI